MAGVYRVNPRIRAYGKARIDVTRRARDEKEWQSLWKAPAHPYPFPSAEGWKFCMEYKVDDYAAEIGFFIDVLGLFVYSFSPSFARFTDPGQNFFFSVTAVQEGEQSTPPDTLRLQLKVSNLIEVVTELGSRGIPFEQPPTPVQEGASLNYAVFRTPHGIPVELLGEVALAVAQPSSETEQIGLEEEEGGRRLDVDEDQVDNDAAVPASDQLPGEKGVENKPASTKDQIGFWSQFSRSVIGLKEKSLRSADPSTEGAERHRPGNGEVTYAPIEDESSDLDDANTDEEYP